MHKQIDFHQGPPGSGFSLGRFLLISQKDSLNTNFSGLLLLRLIVGATNTFYYVPTSRMKGSSISNSPKEPS